ncbi:MAG: hypothetical protein ABI615_06200 [Chthoniobacterales bacterium]
MASWFNPAASFFQNSRSHVRKHMVLHFSIMRIASPSTASRRRLHVLFEPGYLAMLHCVAHSDYSL